MNDEENFKRKDKKKKDDDDDDEDEGGVFDTIMEYIGKIFGK